MSDEARGDSSRRSAATENPNKNDDNEEVRGNSSHGLPEWLEEFKDDLVDESVPEHGDASSSSHESPLEPRAKVVSGKHSFFTQLPERPKLRYLPENQNYKGFLQKTCWYSRAQSGKKGDLTTAGHKILSEESESRNNHRYAVVVQDLATQWLQSYPWKTKVFSKLREACKSSWSRQGNEKSFTLTIP